MNPIHRVAAALMVLSMFTALAIAQPDITHGVGCLFLGIVAFELILTNPLDPDL